MDNAISFAQFEMEDGFVCLPPSLIALENFTSPYGDLKLEFNCSARPELTWESASSMVLKGSSKGVKIDEHCGEFKTYLWNESIGLAFQGLSYTYDELEDISKFKAGGWSAYKFELTAGESITFKREGKADDYCSVLYMDENLRVTSEISVSGSGKYIVVVSDISRGNNKHTFEFQ